MRFTATCPKCSGRDLLFVEGETGAYGVGNNIRAGVTVFSSVLVKRYICCRCGYSEEWIDQNDIQKLTKRYPRVNFTGDAQRR